MNRIVLQSITRDNLRKKAAYYAENSMVGYLMPKDDGRREPLLKEIEEAYLAGWTACERH